MLDEPINVGELEPNKLYLWVLEHRTTVVWLTDCGKGVTENAGGHSEEWWFADKLAGSFFGPLNVQFTCAYTEWQEF